MIELGGYVRDIFRLNKEEKNFRIFGPDETMSNRLGHVFEEDKPPVAGRHNPGAMNFSPRTAG